MPSAGHESRLFRAAEDSLCLGYQITRFGSADTKTASVPISSLCTPGERRSAKLILVGQRVDFSLDNEKLNGALNHLLQETPTTSPTKQRETNNRAQVV
jgi:hypothetical protein